MANIELLTPTEAAYIATNAYFTLKDWINESPKAGVESRAVVQNRVLGPGNVGSIVKPNNPTLQSTPLAGAALENIHTARTGLGAGVSSGFGYTLSYTRGSTKHMIVAARGTRPEMSGKPDLLTDLHGTLTPFMGLGRVHAGFKKTFDSIVPSVERDRKLIDAADAVHFVGHSLGGAVATLLATHYARRVKSVRLYTFGSPRVGDFNTYTEIERAIGKANIFRVAHDLDPISLVAPFPFIHVNPTSKDRYNLTIKSPVRELFGTANHDMDRYINSTQNQTWSGLSLLAGALDCDEAIFAKWLLNDEGGSRQPGWVQIGCAKTLTILFRLIKYALSKISRTAVLAVTALDLLSEALYRGAQFIGTLGSQVLSLLRYAATWAGLQVAKGAQFTLSVIRTILAKMLSAVQSIAAAALATVTRNLVPMSIGFTGAWALTNVSPL